MVRSQTPEPVGADQSLGDLVALAAKDVSQLLRYEIDLAKTEMRGDLRRVGTAAGLGVAAAFVGCLMVVLLCFAYAFGLVALGIWAWAAFLIVAGTCLLLIGLAGLVAYLAIGHLSGLRRTRESVAEGISVLRGSDDQEAAVSGADGRASISRAGRAAGITARESR